MKLNITTFGYKQFQRQFRKMQLESRKYFSKFLEKVADTAVEKAKELAPVKTGLYRKSIKKQMLSYIRARVMSERVTYKKGAQQLESKGHGHLAGILEYGSVKMEARPHLQKAIEYALKVHEKELNQLMHGLFATYLRDFGD
ncbi:MAG: HK97 gp10 family phage protein [Candidatus Riflebacteria bacterium]|jgi:HK97 gp10 family phage protein|nr:HK97 gp10 family phage protein [Candidatus Riflebacteria bacterium]